jgi:NAD(P)-dependent dehydrogenase (short-subunit alcohol dehydrogenase family)
VPRRVAEQVAVVTGASSGIGRATVRELSARGARVVAGARALDALQDLAEECRRDGGSEVVPVATDVREYDEVAALATAAVERFGRIDTWVNCAAVHEYAWFEDSTPEEFDAVLRTNVMGQVHGAYAALPHLTGNDAGGVLIGVSSVEGVRAVPLQAPYVTSKFALRGFYDTVRMEMAARHPEVKVITILPASIDTPIFDHALTKLPRMPMPPKPLYAPETVARAIVHVAGHPRGQREVPVGGSAAMFLLGQRFAPALMDFVLSRRNGMADQQQTELSPVDGDNLVRPADPHTTGSKRLESSSKVGSVKKRSYVTELVWQHPMAKRAVLLAGLGGAAALVRIPRRVTTAT